MKGIKLPKECYSSGIKRMFGIASPSRYMAAAVGYYGEAVAEECYKARMHYLRLRVKERLATRGEWRTLWRHERLEAKINGIPASVAARVCEL